MQTWFVLHVSSLAHSLMSRQVQRSGEMVRVCFCWGERNSGVFDQNKNIFNAFPMYRKLNYEDRLNPNFPRNIDAKVL